MHPTFYITLLYMAILIASALFIFFRKVKNSEDFYLAGRSLGPFMMAGSLTAAAIRGKSRIFVAPFLRKFMATAVPEILAYRYSAPSFIITMALSLETLFIATPAQVKVISSIIQTVFSAGFVMVAVVVTFYMMLGGLASVVFTNIVHIIFILPLCGCSYAHHIARR